MNTKVEKLIEAHEELYTEIYRVASLVYKFRNAGNTRGFDEEDHIEIYSDTIDIGYDTYDCGDYDHERLKFPQAYLFSAGWEDDLQMQMEKEQQEKEAQDLQRKLDTEKARLEQEHKKYLELKAKFGDAS